MREPCISKEQFEEQVFIREGIRIVIITSDSCLFPEYDYQRRAPGNMTLSVWIENRIAPLIGKTATIVTIKGNGTKAVNQTTLETVRKSYTFHS